MRNKIPLAIISGDKEIVELARDVENFDLVGVFDPSPKVDTHNLPYLGPDENYSEVKKKYPGLKVVLALDPTKIKESVAKHYGFDNLATLISSDAYISSTAKIKKGCLIQRGVKIMANTQIGMGSKINVNATVHHDCKIGKLCTLAPGSLILGKVTVEERVFVGAGAIILPKVRIAKDVIIGAGAVVASDIPAGITVTGIPAKELKK